MNKEKIVDMILELTKEECSYVKIHSAYPDFDGPGFMIEICDYCLSNIESVDITGDSLEECLEIAIKRKEDERTLYKK